MSKDNDKTLENSPKINQKAEKPKFQIPKKTLSEYFNIEDLKQIQRNALSKKEIDYAEAVELRIKEIIDAEFGILGDRFFKSLDAHEANLYEKHNKNVRANFIRRMVKNHGIFEKNIYNHIKNKQGCPQCSKPAKLTKELFIEKLISIHGKIYDYSNVIYNHGKDKV